MTAVMPAGVGLARDIVGPAMEAAVARLSPEVRRVSAYHLGMTDAELLEKAYDRLQNVLAQEWEKRSADAPYTDPYQALIMSGERSVSLVIINGIPRLGTPALTTRGMKEAEMRTIAKWIGEALRGRNDEARLRDIRGRVSELAEGFPLYGWLRN